MTGWTPRAVIFDFDGTLADSFAGITATINHVRALHRLPPLPESEVRVHVGRGPIHLLVHTVPSGDPEANLAAYRQHHPTVMLSRTRLFPGVSEVLADLKTRGLRMAVCSNKLRDFTRQLVDYLGIGDYFAVVIGPEDAPQPKPAPDMLVEAMRRLGVAPEQTLYVGDMTVDIQTAKAAKVAVWVVPSGSETEAEIAAMSPDRVLRRFADLTTALRFAERPDREQRPA
jgi:phosphoglycolate phosphatase